MLKWFFEPLAGTTNADVRHNFIANVFDGALFSFALSMVSIQTVLPLFIKKIGGGNVVVGLVPVIWTFGINFPQIFFAHHAQREVSKKQLMLKTGLIQRLPWLALSIFVYLSAAYFSTVLGLTLFLTAFGVAAIGGSVNFPVWFDLIAKITPVEIRGRLFAMRSVFGSTLGILGGSIVAFVLAGVSFPLNYALLFFFAFVSMMASYWFLTTLREEPGTIPQKVVRRRDILRLLPQILSSDRNYRNFLVADALLIASTMANAFYTVYAFEKFVLPDSYAGTFTVVLMTGMIVGSLALGYVADRFGHKLNYLVSAVATAVGCAVAIAATTVEWYLIVFLASAVSVGVMMISRLSLVAELCSVENRPSYVALTNLITSPCILAGVAAGWMSEWIGFESIFILAGLFSLVAIYWLLRKVQEPRHHLAPVTLQST